MNNVELLKMLNDVDERFLTEEYQPTINKRYKESFKERMIRMKNIKLKYVLAPVSMMIIAVIGYAGFLNINKNINNKPITDLAGQVKEESLATIININRIDDIGMMQLDADVKIINNINIPYFEFLSNIEIPEDFDNKENYRAIYTRSNKDGDNYDILHNYQFEYCNTSNNRMILISFSDKYVPLRDYFISDSNKISKIGDTELKISQYNDMYIVTFTHNGINFDIETIDITQEELISLLESIIIRCQESNKVVEDKDTGMKEQINEVSNSSSYPDFYAGKYVDEKGNNVILLCEDNEVNRKEICKWLGITENKTIFKVAKYSYNYLEQLQTKISNAMSNKELPFVTSSALRDNTNNIVVTVTSNDEKNIEKIKELDAIGGAIEIKFNENNGTHDLLLEKK